MNSEAIYLDREGMHSRIAVVIPYVDKVGTALGKLPDPPDSGIATDLVGFIASAGTEAARLAADLSRLLLEVSKDVVDDIANTDSKIADELRHVEKEFDK